MAEPDIRHKPGDTVQARFQSVDVIGVVESVEVVPAQVFYSLRTRDGMFVTVHADYVQEVKGEPGK